MTKNTIYRRIYEEHHGVKLPKGMHVHHIDGNRANNHIDNLLACTPQEHARIHMEQGDFVRAGAIGGANGRGVKRPNRREGRITKKNMCWVWSKYKAYPLGSDWRTVKCIETGETWPSLYQAVKAIRCDRRSLLKSAEGYTKKGRTYVVL